MQLHETSWWIGITCVERVEQHLTGWHFQVQKVCYSHEGTLNKFLIDDKGMHESQMMHVLAQGPLRGTYGGWFKNSTQMTIGWTNVPWKTINFSQFHWSFTQIFPPGGYYFLDKPSVYFPKRRWNIFGNVEFLGVGKLCCPDGAEMAEVVPAGLWIATFGAPRWSSTSCFGQHGIGEGHQIGSDLDIGIEY